MTVYELIQLLANFRADDKIIVFNKKSDKDESNPLLIDMVEREIGTGDVKITIIEK